MKKLFLSLLLLLVILCASASAEVHFFSAEDLSSDTCKSLYSAEEIEAAAGSGASEFVGMYGRLFDRNASVIDFGSMTMKKIKDLKEGLAAFSFLEEVDMYGVPLSREQMAELHDAFPDIHFGWILSLGKYKIRTDITAFSSLHSPQSTKYSSAYYEPLKYCWKLEALDLGHNKLTDISFIGTMTHLKVLILADNVVRDITPLSNLRELEYVELFMNGIRDLSPLQGLENLVDLNVCYNKLKDVSAVYTLPRLERLWLTRNKLTDETKQELVEKLPDVEIVFNSYGSTGAGWREHERYFVIKDMFASSVYRPFKEAE